jgi:hypothetical protein
VLGRDASIKVVGGFAQSIPDMSGRLMSSGDGFGAIANALYVFPARIEDVRPYMVRLAPAIASSGVFTTSTTTTGPNVSSLAMAASRGTSVFSRRGRRPAESSSG